MARQRRSSRRHSQRRNRRRQRGGDASNWATSVYGGPDSQTALPGSGNLIAAQNLSGVNMHKGGSHAPGPASSSTKGGSATAVPGPASHVKGGRGILTDVAVPAVLLYANNAMKGCRRTKRSKRHSRRR